MKLASVLFLFLAPCLAFAADLETSPVPLPRPDVDEAATAKSEEPQVTEVDSDTQVEQENTTPQWQEDALSDEAYDACVLDLDNLGVRYHERETITSDETPDCGIQRPIVVDEIADGVAITPEATLRCDAVRALALWTRDFVLPAADRLAERGALIAIQNGSDYVCRARNGTSDGKLSQHALGSGFDVMGFTFAKGPSIPIEPREAEGTMAEAFQDAVRASACLDFTTVLGPGSNEAHETHLHLDVITRASGYRICEQGE